MVGLTSYSAREVKNVLMHQVMHAPQWQWGSVGFKYRVIPVFLPTKKPFFDISGHLEVCCLLIGHSTFTFRFCCFFIYEGVALLYA